jgi:hypothetical protein
MRRSALLFDSDHRPTTAFASFLHDAQIPGHDLVAIDVALQHRFFQKGPDGQPLERWELKAVETSVPAHLLLQNVGIRDFLLETRPSRKNYTYAAWPGALTPRAAVRLYDLISARKSGVIWRETIVLSGQRPLQTDKEGVYHCCHALNIDYAELEYLECWNAISPLTELDMMRFLWQVALKQTGLSFNPPTFIEAPMKPPLKPGGSPLRPNTEDTIHQWLNDTNPLPGSVLLSSGAPYGMAQDETFWKVLGPRGFTVETFGRAAPHLPIEALMREVAGCVHQIRAARLGL